jgi:polyisoprenoid-binding protein YceI
MRGSGGLTQAREAPQGSPRAMVTDKSLAPFSSLSRITAQEDRPMQRLFLGCAVLALAACSPKPAAPPPEKAAAAAPAAAATSTAPAGEYALDPAHTNISFKITHLGFSHYTADFDKADAKLHFDPANPAAMTVEATIDVNSLDLNTPPAGFHEELMSPLFFDAKRFPTITFKSTKVELTGADTAKLTGDLTLHGVTKPVTLETTFNGGYAPNAFDGARIGFSAHGVLKRSDFGMSAGLPPPGATMGVFDDVTVTIETEFGSGSKIASPGA